MPSEISDPIPSIHSSTYSFWAFKPFYGDLTQPKQTKADQCIPRQTEADQVCKYESMQVSQVGQYASIQVSQACKYPK